MEASGTLKQPGYSLSSKYLLLEGIFLRQKLYCTNKYIKNILAGDKTTHKSLIWTNVFRNILEKKLSVFVRYTV